MLTQWSSRGVHIVLLFLVRIFLFSTYFMKLFDSFLSFCSEFSFRALISHCFWFLSLEEKESKEPKMMPLAMAAATTTATTKKKEKKNRMDLISWVFSWSIPDIMNKTLLKDKVKEIPLTFSSTEQYLASFVYTLIEETHADLFSSMTTVSRAPVCEVFDIKVSDKCIKTSDDNECLEYLILFQKIEENGKEEEQEGRYEPQYGDLFALTDVKPKGIDDLNRPKRPYTLAIIQGLLNTPPYFPILSSKPIKFKKESDSKDKNGGKLYAVYLTNMVTNNRIWKALHSDQKVVNMNIIKNVLQIDSRAGEDCVQCSTGRRVEEAHAVYSNVIGRFTNELDHSQVSAVLKCIETKDCHHRNTVKLIWGPPGTGKTKTVASLLAIFLKMNCRTLTCTPTNIAVLGVVNRLIHLVRPTLEFDTYGLGDIVLFGNKERMKIDDYEDLFDVFLDYRVYALRACLAPVYGWKGSLEAMIQLLEEPEKKYQNYLKTVKDEDVDEEDEQEEESRSVNMQSHSKQDRLKNVSSEPTKITERKALFNKVIAEAVKHNKKKSQEKKKASKKNLRGSKKDKECKTNEVEVNKQEIITWTFEEFFIREFQKIGERLIFYLTSLYTHLPSRLIQVAVAMEMIRLIDMLRTLGTSFDKIVAANKMLREAFCDFESATHRKNHFKEVRITRKECLKVLNFLQSEINISKLITGDSVRDFCLNNATLIFCTASSSGKLHTNEMTSLDMLIVDEAAQLKECESSIPLQLPGLRHAILIGDEKQLPAMVQSKISEGANFGRSLFQRLVILKHEKQLLSVQYRMHPSISLFPNKEFYGGQIKDGRNVKAQSYQKRFLDGQMYGPYSFIDIRYGKEQLNDKHSSKNIVEVYVIAEIIANLHKKSKASKQKLRVGCISPYKAQVFAIQDKLGKTYSTDADSEFSVNVRSVDGFQGGEEDVIIISTVRCNVNASVGFLSNLQRTNVALTRARHCLWILGNSTTLINSGSIWKKLVLDAKARDCFHDATDDNNLVRAISSALLELRLYDKLLSVDFLLLRTARWKVNFSKEFLESMARNLNLEVYKEAINVIGKLANGWRMQQTQKYKMLTGNSSMSLEVYEVKDEWKLVWTVDVEREKTDDIQVMNVWGIMPSLKIPDLAKDLDKHFGHYTINKISRCKCQLREGNLVVPKKWPADSDSIGRSIISTALNDPTSGLASRFATMRLENDEKRPTSSRMNRNYLGKKKK